MKTGAASDLRFLILAPTSKDAEITADLLRSAGIDTETFTTLDALVETISEEAAAILVGPADPDPDAAWRGLAGGHRGVAHARQRHPAGLAALY